MSQIEYKGSLKVEENIFKKMLGSVYFETTKFTVRTLFQMHFSWTFPGFFKVKIKIFQDSNLW